MKKILLCTFILGLATNVSADCISKAKNAAITKEANDCQMEYDSFYAEARLVKKTASKLVYEVEVGSSYSDGVSTIEFPTVPYTVTAKGDEGGCIITKVAINDGYRL
jgi:hypothetical protein